MKRVNMTLSYQIGEESIVLAKAQELYKQWHKDCDLGDELVITIHPGL